MTQIEHTAYAPPRGGRGDAAFDETDEDGVGRGPMLLGVAFAVIVAFAAVIWSAYHQGVREGGRDAPPIIPAGDEPYRVAPLDPGGRETRHLDIDLFDRLSGDRADEAPRDTAALTIREPEEAADSGSRGADSLSVIRRGAETSTADDADAAEREAIDLAAEDDAADDSEAGVEPIRLAARTPEPTAEAEGVVEPGAPVIRLRPEPRVFTSDDDGAAEAAGDDDAAVDGEGGDFVVQLASHRSEQAATSEWSAIQARLPDLLGDRAPQIIEFDAGDRGVFYRLRLAGFADRARANAFCDLLQARGQDCLTVRN